MSKILTDLGARVEELESRLAFQEDTLIQLSDTIAVQDASIQALIGKLAEVSGKYQDLSYELNKDGKQEDEKPPHY